jgi:hypothetical protein
MPSAWTMFIATFVSCAAIFTLGLWNVSGHSLDFIERYLGFSPDRGGGSVEVVLLLTLIGIFAGLALRLPAKLNAPDSD